MKKVLTAIILAASATAVWASCTTNTYYINGKMTTCTVCCTQFGCTTSCF